MALTGKVPDHPAQFSPSVLVELGRRLCPGEAVFDPFAGLGRRLGALCDRIGATFEGVDIEAWPERDFRVSVGDATDPASYPPPPFTVVTSPVYFDNRISTDYVSGPRPTTKLAGRHAYGISLGRALDARNLARLCRPGREAAHDESHGQAVEHWPGRVLLNVDGPIANQWCAILVLAGFAVVEVAPVVTRRLGGVANRDKRAAHEVVIEAQRMSGR